ncbi:hypothetical protein PM082_017985 [Marasmius tenuissimus]|nr:hypothetical protein PM082_017985 [Marasmius tenuissimus]
MALWVNIDVYLCLGLSASGWEYELTFPEPQAELRDHKLANQPKSLTEIWQNIQEPLVVPISPLKAARLQREHTAMSVKRYTVISETIKQQQVTLPRNVVVPPPLDVAL